MSSLGKKEPTIKYREQYHHLHQESEEDFEMLQMKESLDDTMRTIQEMRLIRNVQEEEGGGQRVHTHSPLQDLVVGMSVRQSSQMPLE